MSRHLHDFFVRDKFIRKRRLKSVKNWETFKKHRQVDVQKVKLEHLLLHENSEFNGINIQNT